VTARSLAEQEAQHGSGVYPLRGIALVRGEGVRLLDEQGRSYLDLASGHGVANLGHGHAGVAKAVAEQARTLITCPQNFASDRRAELYARLTEVCPGAPQRFFLCNSGAEASEAAIRFARVSTGREGVVVFRRGFHGRTQAARAATWNAKAQEQARAQGFVHVAYGDLEAARAAVGEDTAAVMLELVQGEGGVHPADADWVRGIAALCRESGALLVVDEVQTGFGRTGRMFACDHFEGPDGPLVPDLLTMGKAIAGGLPVGAVAIGERVTGLAPGVHGGTFGGNALCSAAAVATIDAIRTEHLAENAAELGGWLLEHLRSLDLKPVREVRGMGLMVGIELKTRSAPVLNAMLERGVLALPAGRAVVRLLPPLCITRAELEEGIGAFVESLEETAAAGAR
jgi:acetylornithine/LysW-gamma-L-lysine aminotransferase